MIIKIITVTAMAAFEIYAALGAAHAFGFDTWLILTCTLVGGIAGVFIAAFLGDKIEKFITKILEKCITKT